MINQLTNEDLFVTPSLRTQQTISNMCFINQIKGEIINYSPVTSTSKSFAFGMICRDFSSTITVELDGILPRI